MATSQAFRNALHVPVTNPAANQVVTAETAGALYTSGWELGAAGASGSLILVGAGAPADGLGAAGNYYIDTGSDRIYGPKAASTPFWPDALNMTAAELVAKIAAADGAGSGLDADRLDGADGAAYLDLANHTGILDFGTY